MTDGFTSFRLGQYFSTIEDVNNSEESNQIVGNGHQECEFLVEDDVPAEDLLWAFFEDNILIWKGTVYAFFKFFGFFLSPRFFLLH